jgi:hypothetical protein
MSWSITLIGKPENIATALTAQSEKFDGQTKIEFDAALPHLVGLVSQNFANITPVLKLEASGHGYATNGEQVQRTCLVKIESLYGQLV